MRDSSLLLFATGSLPLQVVLDVVSTDTVAKGDEKAPQYKPAIVGSGRKVMVPPFIATGWQLHPSHFGKARQLVWMCLNMLVQGSG